LASPMASPKDESMEQMLDKELVTVTEMQKVLSSVEKKVVL